MQYRTDQRSGNQLSALGFGCMRLPRNIGGIDMKKTEQLIVKAVEEGVNYFDSAYIYPGSEVALGNVLANNNLRDKVYIATKLPIGSCRKTEDFQQFFNMQLKNLQTGHFDYYLMHNINSFQQWQDLCAIGVEDWIEDQKADGTIRQVGFSFHGVCKEFIKVLDSYDWDFCQIQYNYSDDNYQAGVTGLKHAAAKGLPVIIMEPLLGGKLATGLPKKAEEVFQKANASLSPAAWGLRWLLDQPQVTVILSGMNSDKQLTDNLCTVNASAPGMLTEPEKEAYRQVIRILHDTYKVPCTGCGYCMPCPQNVNIPGCFAAYNTSYAMGRMAGFMQYATGTAATRLENQIAGNCVGCGKCESHCPQHIAIRKTMEDVKKRMEPFYFKAIISIMQNRQRKQKEGQST